MRLIIAGPRRYHPPPAFFAALDAIDSATPITEEVCGTDPRITGKPVADWGVDEWGCMWAITHGIPVNADRSFEACWTKYGTAAGPIRNGEMADYGDALAYVPDGTGTADMLRKATAAGLRIVELFQTEAAGLRVIEGVEG